MGISTLPNTKEKAEKLKTFMEEKFSKDKAEEHLYRVLGDDLLLDAIRFMLPQQDARPLIALRLKAIMDQPLSSFEKPWEPEAVLICRKILREREMEAA